MMLNKTFHLLLLSLIPLLGFSQANSQYPDSGNKIRLGFQTSGDGLIWRDTQPNVGVYQPINNKAAWIVLDTVNNKFYHYKNSAWTLAGGSDTTSIAYVNTYGTQTVNGAKTFTTAPTFSTALLGGSGGTGITTFGAATRIPYASSATALTTSSNLTYNNTFLKTNAIAIGDTALSTSGLASLLSISGEGAGFTLKSTYYAPILRSFSFLINAVGNAGFWNNNTSSYAYFINNSDNFLGIGNVSPTEKLHVTGNARITGNVGIGVTAPTNAIDMVGQIRMTGATIASGLTKNINISGSQNFTDDEVKTISAGNVTFIMVTDNNLGGGALFFASYSSGTIVELADPSNIASVTDLDGFLCVYKSASSATINVKNRLGSTKSITVSQITVGD